MVENVLKSYISVPPLGSYNSPILGSKTVVEVPVTIQQANGEIGFQNTYTITVSEPETSPYSVSLGISLIKSKINPGGHGFNIC